MKVSSVPWFVGHKISSPTLGDE